MEKGVYFIHKWFYKQNPKFITVHLYKSKGVS